ncbi:MAG: hypothetical protein H6Q84_926, partial [Deltaproteobacteria bacterium]|nr:hypothetical protein [Deltaproteobacteria bacterium]
MESASALSFSSSFWNSASSVDRSEWLRISAIVFIPPTLIPAALTPISTWLSNTSRISSMAVSGILSVMAIRIATLARRSSLKSARTSAARTGSRRQRMKATVCGCSPMRMFASAQGSTQRSESKGASFRARSSTLVALSSPNPFDRTFLMYSSPATNWMSSRAMIPVTSFSTVSSVSFLIVFRRLIWVVSFPTSCMSRLFRISAAASSPTRLNRIADFSWPVSWFAIYRIQLLMTFAASCGFLRAHSVTCSRTGSSL